jgi:hypothetical protein
MVLGMAKAIPFGQRSKSMNEVLLIQPGAFGDIIACAPIAKWYADQGKHVFWPAAERFRHILNYFSGYIDVGIIPKSPPVAPGWMMSDVIKILGEYRGWDEVVNLADRGPHATAQLIGENFEQCKYRVAGVPFKEKHNLSWRRDPQKELDLFRELGLSEDEEYNVVHRKDSKGNTAIVPSNLKLRRVEVEPVEGYSIFDWYKVIIQATDVYCTESSIHQFVDGIINDLRNKPFLMQRPGVKKGIRSTTSEGWNLSLLGEHTQVLG